jgi:SRSO17 transposase
MANIPILPFATLQEVMKQTFEELEAMLKPLFAREETRQSALAYLKGLLSSIERKNSWQLAEEAGLAAPYAFQYLLDRALWEADALRDEVQHYTLHQLGTEQSVMGIDETGFLKKGKQSAGVSRQYSGTAGRIDNCQVGVFLSYATSQGRALIDRALYIPKVWFEDKIRCQKAGIPDSVSFKTKPELAQQMLEQAFAQGIKPDWVAGDEIYSCYTLRSWLESQQQAYVLALAANYPVHLGLRQYRVKEVLALLAEHDWQRLSAGAGTQGERYYEWQRIEVNSMSPEGWARWLLLRRRVEQPEDIAYYMVFAPNTRTLVNMAKAAGSRWTIEECFEMAKGEVGLDHYEVRSYQGWYRHITFCLLALCFLTVLRQRFNQPGNYSLEKKQQTNRKHLQRFLQSRGLA